MHKHVFFSFLYYYSYFVCYIFLFMAKIKSTYFCQSCGTQSPKWVGRCPGCGEWNTFVEEIIEKEDKASWKGSSTKIAAKPRYLGEIQYNQEKRLETPDGELNRVLGGGIVPGSIVLIGGNLE